MANQLCITEGPQFIEKMENIGGANNGVDVFGHIQTSSNLVLVIGSKHSGSLATVSTLPDEPILFGTSKNSTDNEFSKFAVALVVKFARRAGTLPALVNALHTHRIVLCLEIVARNVLGQHGQHPVTDNYFVVTAINYLDETKHMQTMDLISYIRFCCTYCLPIPKTWVFWNRDVSDAEALLMALRHVDDCAAQDTKLDELVCRTKGFVCGIEDLEFQGTIREGFIASAARIQGAGIDEAKLAVQAIFASYTHMLSIHRRGMLDESCIPVDAFECDKFVSTTAEETSMVTKAIQDQVPMVAHALDVFPTSIKIRAWRRSDDVLLVNLQLKDDRQYSAWSAHRVFFPNRNLGSIKRCHFYWLRLTPGESPKFIPIPELDNPVALLFQPGIRIKIKSTILYMMRTMIVRKLLQMAITDTATFLIEAETKLRRWDVPDNFVQSALVHLRQFSIFVQNVPIHSKKEKQDPNSIESDNYLDLYNAFLSIEHKPMLRPIIVCNFSGGNVDREINTIGLPIAPRGALLSRHVTICVDCMPPVSAITNSNAIVLFKPIADNRVFIDEPSAHRISKIAKAFMNKYSDARDISTMDLSALTAVIGSPLLLTSDVMPTIHIVMVITPPGGGKSKAFAAINDYILLKNDAVVRFDSDVHASGPSTDRALVDAINRANDLAIKMKCGVYLLVDKNFPDHAAFKKFLGRQLIPNLKCTLQFHILCPQTLNHDICRRNIEARDDDYKKAKPYCLTDAGTTLQMFENLYSPTIALISKHNGVLFDGVVQTDNMWTEGPLDPTLASQVIETSMSLAQMQTMIAVLANEVPSPYRRIELDAIGLHVTLVPPFESANTTEGQKLLTTYMAKTLGMVGLRANVRFSKYVQAICVDKSYRGTVGFWVVQTVDFYIPEDVPSECVAIYHLESQQLIYHATDPGSLSGAATAKDAGDVYRAMRIEEGLPIDQPPNRKWTITNNIPIDIMLPGTVV